MEDLSVFIENNLRSIETCIRAAQARSLRAASSVRLLAVSKRQSIEKMNCLKRLLDSRSMPVCFGENYVQELRDKRAVMGEGCKFHFIGRLQKNKVRDAVRYSNVVESVDSEELASLLDHEAGKQQRVLDVFLQVNISDDEHKGGFGLDEARSFVAEVLPDLRNLKLRGLMTMLMYYADTERYRRDYAVLREFRDLLLTDAAICGALEIDSLELSMGLSEDFEVAVEEGATEVRIGTALFGARE